jgi:hypothetical protein
MRNIVVSCLAALAVSASTFAASVSSVTCDSHMKFGFFSGNENGTFSYVASPLTISVSVPGKGEVTIDDSTHICTITVSAADAQFSVTSDNASTVDLYFGSKNSSNSEDGGNLAIHDGGNGSFSCRNLPGLSNSGITLSNCVLN